MEHRLADVEHPVVGDANGRRRQRRITVVDESDEFVALMRDVFTEGYRVDVPSEKSITAIAETRPDLLVIDLNMAFCDGTTGSGMVRLLREHPALGGLPVVACSTDPLDLDRGAGHLTGRGDVEVLLKPFALHELESTVVGLVAGEP